MFIPDKMVTTSNSVNTALKFTVDISEDNYLPFLDTRVALHPHNGRFSTKLYIKPIHSQCITPWDSHGPISVQKRGILIGEIRRAMSRSTNPRSQQNSLRLITKPYTKNGYPRSFIINNQRHFKKMQVTTVRTRTRSNLHQDAIYQRRSQEANTSSFKTDRSRQH